MVIPLTRPAVCWSELAAEEKLARLLGAAGEVFARQGLDAPMPEVAAAAGAGVGSVYRLFPSKRDLISALVVERLEGVRKDADAALEDSGGPWSGLMAYLRGYAERQAGDDVLGEALGCVSTDPDVVRALAEANAALELLLDAARAEGRLRADASILDLRLLFGATRAAGALEEEGAWQRMLELGIDALSRPGRAGSGRRGRSPASPAHRRRRRRG